MAPGLESNLTMFAVTERKSAGEEGTRSIVFPEWWRETELNRPLKGMNLAGDRYHIPLR